MHREPNTYTTAHARALRPVADLATLAIEHDQLRTLVRERRRKREALEALLPTLARALDVQVVFAQISDVMKDVLPHDYLTVGLVTADGGGIRFHASTPGQVTDAPEYRPTTDFGAESLTWDFYLVFEYTILPDGVVRVEYLDPRLASAGEARVQAHGRRCSKPTRIGGHPLRAAHPGLLQGERVGYLFFTSSARTPTARTTWSSAAAWPTTWPWPSLTSAWPGSEPRHAAQQQATQLQERVDALVEELESVTPHRALGRSRRWQDVLAQATKVAATETTVLITGESGTGKEVVARFIHRGLAAARAARSSRSTARRCPSSSSSRSCSATSGAPSPARSRRAPGRIEQAAGGVLFLDEVGEMSPAGAGQVPARAAGARVPAAGRHADAARPTCACIAATNRDLRGGDGARAASARTSTTGCSVFEIALPPLRERREDILLLAEAFLEEIGRSVGRPAAGVSKDARDRLLGLSLAGQRPRAAQRDRARGDPLRRRADHRRAPADGARRRPPPAPLSGPVARRAPATTRSDPAGGREPRGDRARPHRAGAWLRPRTTSPRRRACSASPAASSTRGSSATD